MYPIVAEFKTIKQLNELMAEITVQIQRRKEMESKRSKLMMELDSINAQLDNSFAPMPPVPSLANDDARRVYAFRNVGDAILEVLPTSINEGMTTGQIVEAIKRLPNAPTYAYITVTLGLKNYFNVTGISGYRIRAAHSPYPQRQTYYKRRNDGV